MSHPSLFIGVPGAGHVYTAAYFAQIAAFSAAARYWERHYGVDAKTGCLITDRLPVAESRNRIAESAIRGEFDYVWWLDDDMGPPPDALAKMMAHIEAGASMVSGLCSKRCLPPEVMAWVWGDDGGFHRVFAPTNKWPETLEVDAVGMACVLMKREVLEAVWAETNGLPFQYANGRYGTEDMYFFETASKLGYKVVLDGTLPVAHVGTHRYMP